VRLTDRFSFAPSDGTLVISGIVAPDGSFAGSLVTDASQHDRQDRSGTEPPPFTLKVTGRLGDAEAAGIYVTPRCRTAFRLPRVEPTLVP